MSACQIERASEHGLIVSDHTGGSERKGLSDKLY